MFVKKTVTKGNETGEERLTLRKISQMADGKVDPQVSRALTTLGYKIVMEIGIDDNVIIGVFDVKTCEKVCTYADFRKMMGIKSILMGDLEARSKGSKRSVAELTLAASERSNAQLLGQDSLRKLMVINPWIIGFKAILKALDTATGGVNSDDRFVQAMVNLTDKYAGVIDTLVKDIRKSGDKRSTADRLYSEMAGVGIPQWFHKSVILSANDFKAKITLDNPYKMFFNPQGTGGIYLTSEELTNKVFLHKFIGLVDSVYGSSYLLESIVDRIHNSDTEFEAGGFVPANYMEGTVLAAFKWSLVLNLTEDEVEGFFNAKSRNKSCPLMPFGTMMFVDRLSRLNLAIIRTSHMEGQDVDATVNLFSNVFHKGIDIIKSDTQANLFSLALKTPDYQQRYSSYLSMDDKDLTEIFIKMIGRLMSVSIHKEQFGAVSNALTDVDTQDFVFDDAEKIMFLILNKVKKPQQRAMVNDNKKPGESDFWKVQSIEGALKACKNGPKELQSVIEKKILTNYSLSAWLVDKTKPELDSLHLKAFRKGGDYYVPVEPNEKTAMEEVEKYADKFLIKEKNDVNNTIVGTNQIHNSVKNVVKKANLKDCLSMKLLHVVSNLVKCFNKEEMQRYVVDVTIATYDDYASGNADAVISDDDVFGLEGN